MGYEDSMPGGTRTNDLEEEEKLDIIEARDTDFQSVSQMVENAEGTNGPCEMIITAIAWLIVAIIPIFWFFLFRTVTDYERALIFRLGKVEGGIRGPGLFVINPLLDKIRIVDQRIETVNLVPQDMMTKDSVTIRVDGIVYTKVIDPVKAILEINNFRYASKMFSATSLRAVVGSVTLETMLTQRDRLNNRLKQIIERECRIWGVTVPAVEIKDVILPPNMQRAMAAEAETERERRAKKISSLGEVEAAQNLALAANTIAAAPGALQLRYLHTLKNISVEKNSTIIFPLPMELMKGFIQKNQLAISK
jgi:regulator of protease activity HflC (stomatin/prohibitin superfamily)